MVSLNWRMSNQTGGSPGIANNAAVLNTIFINELMASNEANNTDENGEYDDWIEIYNTSDNAVSLAGLYLTDKKDNLLKFNIANDEGSVVPAKGFLLFWADEQGSQGSRHANFKLDKEGEWIGLVQVTLNDTIIIDSVLFSEQESDLTYGRYPDGTPYWQKLYSPTPLDNNIADDIEPLPLSFSLDQNYPNPFSQITTIPYKVGIGNTLNVKITIFNILGQQVAVLLDEKIPEGSYEAVWDARKYATGLYFYQLIKGNSVVKRRKMILLK